MKSQNIAIIAVFILIAIIIYQLYFGLRGKNRSNTNSNNSSTVSLHTFDKLDTCSPAMIYEPTTLQELQDIVNKKDSKIRATGDEYIFNELFFTDELLIKLNKLDKILDIDTDANTVTVQAGVTIGKLCLALHDKNLDLLSIPEYDNQTIGNAIMLAAHGANLNSGTLSEHLIDMTVVLSNGHIRRIEFTDPEFPAFATSLGLFGIIYAVTLKCNKPVYVKRVTRQGMIKNTNILELVKNDPLLELSINPAGVADIHEHVLIPVEEISVAQTALQRNGLYTQSRVAIPFEQVSEAVNDTLLICNKFAITDCKINVHFTGSDNNSWLSPTSGRKSAWICIDAQMPLLDQERFYKFLKEFEETLLQKYSGRLDWNTSRFIDAYKVREMYGIVIKYVNKLREKFDPEHVYSNDLIERF